MTHMTHMTLALMLVTGALSGPGEWFTLPDMPSARQEVGVALVDGAVYVVGGFDAAGRSVNTVERFDLAQNRWEPVPDLPAPLPLNHVGAASVGGRLYVFGGLTQGFTAVDSTYEYDPGTNQWRPMADMPAPRGAMGTGVIDGRIYAAGGLPGTRSRHFAVFDPIANQWTPLEPMPTAREHLAGAVVGDVFYAISGRLGPNRNALEAYDTSAARWTALAPIPTPRSGIAAAVVDGVIYVFGGEGNPASRIGIFDEVESYHPGFDAWRDVEPMPIPRHGLGAVESGGRIYLPGGATEAGFGAVDTFDAFEPAPWCYADCETSTGPHTLDIFDFLCFQDAFTSGQAYACGCDKSTGPGVCDIFDFLCFQDTFVGGCP